MKIKPLTKKQKEAEIKNLETLAAKYKQDAKNRGPKKRVMIPFELEIGNFCCPKLNKAFQNNIYTIEIEGILNKYYVWIATKEYRKNHCPYCLKHIDEFFYIKEY